MPQLFLDFWPTKASIYPSYEIDLKENNVLLCFGWSQVPIPRLKEYYFRASLLCTVSATGLVKACTSLSFSKKNAIGIGNNKLQLAAVVHNSEWKYSMTSALKNRLTKATVSTLYCIKRV